MAAGNTGDFGRYPRVTHTKEEMFCDMGNIGLYPWGCLWVKCGMRYGTQNGEEYETSIFNCIG